MALRVLLADESTTIKKVLQLALSDFGVEVKNVPSGIDVLSVALDFHPDIIFADILLSKKNGYEVCAELKNHPTLKNIPVVLMWSSFMEFDENLAQKSNYNGQLEKPFDTEILRALINRLVSKTTSHPLKGLLEFPSIPDFVETDIKQVNLNNNQIEDVDLDYDGHSSPQQNDHLNLNTAHLTQQEEANTRVDLSNPNDIQLETENYGEFEEVILVKTEQSKSALQNKIQNQVQNYIENTLVKSNLIPPTDRGQMDSITRNTVKQHNKPSNLMTQGFQSKLDENLIREEVRVMTEKICWQLIPEIAEKIIREELKKLMQDIEKSI